jgi:hypothetical protein
MIHHEYMEMKMGYTRNVGGADRTIRILAGIALPAVAMLYGRSKWMRGLAGMAGASALTSGLSGYCPMNQVLGINTTKRDMPLVSTMD